VLSNRLVTTAKKACHAAMVLDARIEGLSVKMLEIRQGGFKRESLVRHRQRLHPRWGTCRLCQREVRHITRRPESRAGRRGRRHKGNVGRIQGRQSMPPPFMENGESALSYGALTTAVAHMLGLPQRLRKYSCAPLA
jgi:hypothetical protein